ncbi:MAG: hypothetical protein A2Z88_06210 [Omnitrophica WOR_2 bacterium GWA2_47_8]|nr:MAG: hypothetical protein A2Z88_06210 [Omnitrophica WOR_2 bacterium GWA2_47_8]
MGLNGKEIVQESRASLRVKENAAVRWSIKDSELRGEGRLVNVSTSGMLLEANSAFTPIERSVFSVQSPAANGSGAAFLPQEGRLVWCKKKPFSRNRILCGIQLIDPSTESVSQLRDKVQKKINRSTAGRRIRSVISLLLAVSLIGLTAFIIAQHLEMYQTLELANQQMTTAYQGQVTLTQKLSQELTVTKDLLEQTKIELTAAKAENENLQSLLQQAQTNIAQLEDEKNAFINSLKQLQGTNTQLTGELSSVQATLAAVQERLRILDGDVVSVDEANSRIALFKDKIRFMQTRLKQLRHDAYVAKVTAQKERDALESLYGNNGFMVKEGKVWKPTGQTPSNLKVNVEFVE